MGKMQHLDIQGARVPLIGLGTWALRGETCEDAVLAALDIGYRHIDTAEIYGNERAIGKAWQRSGVPRHQLFITSKVWQNHLHHDDLLAACDQSLEDLGTDYLDLYLIHWPVAGVPISETMAALDELQSAGRARHIGVSNFGVVQLREAQQVSHSGIFCNQIEVNPWRRPDDIVSACQASNVLVTAYTPLARGRVAQSNVLLEVARRHGKTAAQVVLRWLVQQPGVVTIPKASTREHLEENLDVFDFALDDHDVDAINALAG
jgi:2,5-diketo-D-gluconate reductase B